jgi:hypothetical protein
MGFVLHRAHVESHGVICAYVVRDRIGVRASVSKIQPNWPIIRTIGRSYI